MSEQLEQSAQKLATAPTPGEWLRCEREKQGRTVQQVATDLHLSTQIIEAIEANRFAVLGAPVFARGHLRNYANLLRLPIERAHELYDALTDRPRDQDPVPVIHRAGEPSIPMTPDSKDRDVNTPRAQFVIAIVVAVLVIIVALGIWWWLQSANDDAPQVSGSVPLGESVSQTVVEPIQLETPPVATVDTETERSQIAIVPKSADPIAGKAEPVASATPARASAPRSVMRLRLAFADQSWVEVYDARGNRRLYDVGEPGQTRVVQVEPPAEVVLGNAPAVSVEANGRAVTLPTRVANQVARFTLRADGSIQ